MEPSQKLVFNVPFSEKKVYHCRVTNLGAHQIGWDDCAKESNMRTDHKHVTTA